jgi:superoxide dismutase, Cu-Zn family
MMFRALALVAPLAMITACTNAIDTAPTARATSEASAWTVYRSASPSPTVSAEFPPATEAAGTFLPYQPDALAITYDPAVVPPGATARLTITNLPYGTDVQLTATGLIPRRAYGAHLHTMPCTGVPDEAGPHYQNHQDPAATPAAPSTNPVYANPRNEVWLDFTADANGAATSTATHGWDFMPTRPPRSLVLHTEHTHTAPGEAGKAGARVACLTLPAH